MPDSWLDNWYPVMFTADVPADSPVAAQVFERPLVLYRDEEGSALLLLRSLRIALLLPALLAASPPLRIALLRSPPPLLLTACRACAAGSSASPTRARTGWRRSPRVVSRWTPRARRGSSAPTTAGSLQAAASAPSCRSSRAPSPSCRCTARARTRRARERPVPAPSSRRPSRSELASRPTRCVRRRAWPTSFSEPPSVPRGRTMRTVRVGRGVAP